RVRVVDDVVTEVEVLLDHIVDEPTEEHDIHARTDRHMDVRGGTRADEPGVHVDELRAALLGLHHPLKAHQIILDHVENNHDDIRILEIDEIHRHHPTTEHNPQS